MSHLDEVKKRNQKARDCLVAEQVRGYLIKWENNILRAERFSRKAKEPGVDDIHSIAAANALSEAVFDISYDPQGASNCDLRVLLERLTEKIFERILEFAQNEGFSGCDEEEALCFLAKNGSLKQVIDYFEQLESSVTRYKEEL